MSRRPQGGTLCRALHTWTLVAATCLTGPGDTLQIIQCDWLPQCEAGACVSLGHGMILSTAADWSAAQRPIVPWGHTQRLATTTSYVSLAANALFLEAMMIICVYDNSMHAFYSTTSKKQWHWTNGHPLGISN